MQVMLCLFEDDRCWCLLLKTYLKNVAGKGCVDRSKHGYGHAGAAECLLQPFALHIWRFVFNSMKPSPQEPL